MLPEKAFQKKIHGQISKARNFPELLAAEIKMTLLVTEGQ